MTNEKILEQYKKMTNEELIKEARSILDDKERDDDGDTKLFDIYSILASKDDPEGLFGLGNCYFNGIGTFQDLDKAYSLVSLSAKHDFAPALDLKGVFLIKGIGCKSNVEEGIEILNYCAYRYNYAKAFYDLACYYSLSSTKESQNKCDQYLALFMKTMKDKK